ncbi:MAG: hypothetical protein JNK29_09340 [Anaerolineales bacterium]|nr:hypothetical protein [Anaerolineales bacterium]
MPTFLSWLWLLAAFVPLVLLERWIHRHLQGIWLLLFRSPDVATVLYAVVMLPGVLVHELSHWLMATLVGARTGRFSVVPERLPDGTLRLGFVETEQTDVFREALIGAAPLLAGCGVVLAIGFGPLGVGPAGEALVRGDGPGLAQNLLAIMAAPDAWVWIYLLFTVSNSMLPSASDRRAWLPVLAFAAVAAGGLALLGLGSLVQQVVTGPVEAAIQTLAAAFTITVALDLAAAPALWLLEQGLVRVTGLRVEY